MSPAAELLLIVFVELGERGLERFRQAGRFFDEFLACGFGAGLLLFAPGFRQVVADVLVKITQHRQINLLRVVTRREKRNLHQPGFDGFNQTKSETTHWKSE